MIYNKYKECDVSLICRRSSGIPSLDECLCALLSQSKDEPDTVFYVPLVLDLKGLPEIGPEASQACRSLWVHAVCWRHGVYG